jgi:DNA invertase Pin-like site-specific DNA recombinase
MAEALDRFSRDQEDTAGLFKRLTFAGVNVVTLAEGDITHLHIGLKGTMNALFLKELAEKTRRGLRGRIELGKAGGGVSFGYRIVRRLEKGLVTTGEREIVPEEAAIVSTHLQRLRGGRVTETDREGSQCRRCPRTTWGALGPQHYSWKR